MSERKWAEWKSRLDVKIESENMRNVTDTLADKRSCRKLFLGHPKKFMIKKFHFTRIEPKLNEIKLLARSALQTTTYFFLSHFRW